MAMRFTGFMGVRALTNCSWRQKSKLRLGTAEGSIPLLFYTAASRAPMEPPRPLEPPDTTYVPQVGVAKWNGNIFVDRSEYEPQWKDLRRCG